MKQHREREMYMDGYVVTDSGARQVVNLKSLDKYLMPVDLERWTKAVHATPIQTSWGSVFTSEFLSWIKSIGDYKSHRKYDGDTILLHQVINQLVTISVSLSNRWHIDARDFVDSIESCIPYWLESVSIKKMAESQRNTAAHQYRVDFLNRA